MSQMLHFFNTYGKVACTPKPKEGKLARRSLKKELRNLRKKLARAQLALEKSGKQLCDRVEDARRSAEVIACLRQENLVLQIQADADEALVEAYHRVLADLVSRRK